MSRKFCNICMRVSFRNDHLELAGIELMTHPEFGPPIAYLDYYLFRSFAHLLCTIHFNNQVSREKFLFEGHERCPCRIIQVVKTMTSTLKTELHFLTKIKQRNHESIAKLLTHLKFVLDLI